MTQSGFSQALIWGIALIIMLGAAVLAGRATPTSTPIAAASSPGDPALARCRAAGEAALDDPDCRRAWDTARARFFGRAGS
jgi:conjugative transfer region protein TrbK